MTEDEILRDFPELEREDILAALAFAAERERFVRGRSAGAAPGARRVGELQAELHTSLP